MTVGKVKDFNFAAGGMAKGSSMDNSTNCYAKGGQARVKDTIRNERQELNRVSAKQRDAGKEVSRVRSEMRYDKNELKGMNSGGREMLKNRGTLGVIANKNPGETRMNTAPNLPGEKMMMNKGGMAMKKGGMAMSKGKGKNC